jgi:pyruvate dehydrogenase E2 component (dihydrolipoamide acetyltransferase)
MAIEITIPRLGWSMEEGRFLGWQKQDGDRVAIGDVLYELEGEKAIQEVESVDNGILRIPPDCPKADTMLTVGALLGYITEENEPAPWLSRPAAASEAPVVATASERETKKVPPAAGPAVRRMARQLGVAIESITGSGPAGRVFPGDLQTATSRPRTPATKSGGGEIPAGRIVATPRARRVAGELEIDWSGLPGSGRDGRIREADVRSAVGMNGSKTAPAPRRPSPPGRRIPITSRRRTIARRMAASQQESAPVTLHTRADATALVQFRNSLKTSADPVPAFTDIIACLVARVLHKHPLLAGRWDDDAIVVPFDDGFHVGIAVDTEDGLVVPVLRDVLHQTPAALAKTSRELIERARQGKATAAEFDGGVFTVTNLGSFGIDEFTPIINVPETAILGLGAIRRDVVVGKDDRLEPRDLLTLSLTFDHRVVDGAPAARFLADLRSAIEAPAALIA